jgi:hypothetical protein
VIEPDPAAVSFEPLPGLPERRFVAVEAYDRGLGAPLEDLEGMTAEAERPVDVGSGPSYVQPL